MLAVGVSLQADTSAGAELTSAGGDMPICSVWSERIMVDRGCAKSVSPKAFAKRPITQDRRYAFTLADGTALPHHGSTVVPYVADGQALRIPFEVADVSSPLLSVADTLDPIGGEILFTK